VIKTKGMTVKGLSRKLREQGLCGYDGYLQHTLKSKATTKIEIAIWEAICKELL